MKTTNDPSRPTATPQTFLEWAEECHFVAAASGALARDEYPEAKAFAVDFRSELKHARLNGWTAEAFVDGFVR